MKDIIKNQKLFFISLIGIVVVSLIMGTTYAYQTLEVETTEGSDTSMTVNVGKLNVTFNLKCKDGETCDEENNNYDRINLSNMPLLTDYKTADYVEFSLATNDTTDDVAYQINLVDLDYSEALISSDFKYTITEVTTSGEKIIGEGDFNDLSGTNYTFNLKHGTYSDVSTKIYNYINIKDTQTLRLYLWLNETEGNQNSLENTYFKGKIDINSFFNGDINIAPNVVYRCGTKQEDGSILLPSALNESDLNNYTYDENSSECLYIDEPTSYGSTVTSGMTDESGNTITECTSGSCIFSIATQSAIGQSVSPLTVVLEQKVTISSEVSVEYTCGDVFNEEVTADYFSSRTSDIGMENSDACIKILNNDGTHDIWLTDSDNNSIDKCSFGEQCYVNVDVYLANADILTYKYPISVEAGYSYYSEDITSELDKINTCAINDGSITDVESCVTYHEVLLSSHSGVSVDCVYDSVAFTDPGVGTCSYSSVETKYTPITCTDSNQIQWVGTLTIVNSYTYYDDLC